MISRVWSSEQENLLWLTLKPPRLTEALGRAAMRPFFRSVLLLARSSSAGVLAWLQLVATFKGE